ncbi:MAG: hypothetical protein QM723_07990 [Myxococcaceae bacterium]
MTFTRPTFWEAPFPSDDRVKNGKLNLLGFDARQIELIGQVMALNSQAKGFATTGAIFFTTTTSLDPAKMPSIADTVKPSSPVFVIELDGPEPGRRFPLEVSYCEACSAYGAARTLTLLPLQGVPLHPGARYAAVVMRGLNDATGKPLGVSLSMAQLLGGELAAGLSSGDSRRLQEGDRHAEVEQGEDRGHRGDDGVHHR